MTDQERTEQEELDAVAKFFAQGGQTIICPPGQRTDPELISNQWGKRKVTKKK